MRCLAVCLLAAAPLLAQGRLSRIPDDLRFEVASFKPSDPALAGRGGGIRPAQGGIRYVANNITIRTMLQAAYRLKPEQVVGGPSWLDNELFDMQGKAAKPSDGDELHVMLKNLLVDRCKLTFHHEMKEMPAYVLMAGDKGEPKLVPHDEGNAGDIWIDVNVEEIVKVKMKATYCPMDYFAFRLGLLLDRPVVDMTRLKGSYDFEIAFTRDLPPGVPENAQVNGVAIDTSGPTVFAAMKQQLGLEFRQQKAPVEILVIDHIEKPVAN